MRRSYRRWLGVAAAAITIGLLPAGTQTQERARPVRGVASHAAVWLEGARWLAAGGTTSQGPSDRLEILSVDGTASVTTLTHPRSSHASTLLPDGSVLITGGANAGSPLDTLEIVDPALGASTELGLRLPRVVTEHAAALIGDGQVIVTGGRGAGGSPTATVQSIDLANSHAAELVNLVEPRAGHTATLLTDGRMLIAGGQGPRRVLDSAETWDGARLVSTSLSHGLTSARTGHTATLLPSGEVLIVGGLGANRRPLATVETFDPVTGMFRSERFRLVTARARHTATLLPTGGVLVWGGVDAAGALIDSGEVIDSRTGVVRQVQDPLAGVGRDMIAPALAASVPADKAQGVSTSTTIAFRFSEPLAVTSVTTSRVSLGGAGGLVAAKVVPAESGLLIVLTPQMRLDRGTTYTVQLDGLVDTAGLPLPSTVVEFTTEGVSMTPIGSGSGGSSTGDGTVPPGDDDTRIARDVRTGKPLSRWLDLPPLQAAPGVTAVAGQVLQLNGEPLANVTLRIDGAMARSDATGRFLLTDLRSGQRVFTMDGHTANRPGATYGIFDTSVTVAARQTNVLPYTIWMSKLDMANVVTFTSPTKGEVVLRTPKIPGLEIHLEPGTVLEDRDGRPVRQLGITPIPPDRPPFPLPEPFAMYFTIQPGGVSLTRGARAVYPNVENAEEGKSWDFWSHEPEGGVGWYRYGKGRVRHGRQHIDPDPDTRIYKITVHGCCPLGEPGPLTGPAAGSPNGGDPVNLSSGLFVLEKTDLVIPDVIPIVIQRTYRPEDSAMRGFGVGGNHPYGMTLVKVGSSFLGWQEANLFLPDGGRIHYQMIQSGPNWPTDWRWEHRDTPTGFFKSRLHVDPVDLTFHLTLRDGTTYLFATHTGRLLEQRDRYGNRLVLTRDPQTDLIMRVTSPNGRTVDFVYDMGNRIAQVIDQLGRTVSYEYDGSSRLIKVTDAAGGATAYTYDAAGRMATIKDPRGIVWLTNEYYTTGPDTGRVKKQTLASPSLTYQLSYTNDAQGRITQTDLTDPRGIVRRTTFNTAGYPLTDTFALGLPEAQTITYEPDTDPTKGNLVRAVTDALARRTEYDYDTSGNVTQVRRLAGTADQITSTLTYEPCFFDTPAGFCRVTAVTPSTATTDGRVTIGYSGLAQTTITDPRGQPTTISYNAAGLPTQVLSPLGAPPMQYGYTSGLLSSVTDRLGRVTTRAYDGGGRLVSQTDPSWRTTRYAYSALNQLTAVADPGAGVTHFTYDPNGNLLTVKDAKGNTTSYSYDTLDRVQQRTDPLGKSETFQYDGNDNLTQHTDRKNQVTASTYDGLNRLTGTTGAGYTETRTWDAGNRLTQIVDSVGGTITNAWDGLDRLTTETTALGVVRYDNPSNPADRGYDTLGRRLWMEVPGQVRVLYTWDPASRLTQLQQGSQIATFAYDNANRRTLLTLPNGASTEYQYDLASQLTALIYRDPSATELGRLAYGYDLAGNRTLMGESFASTLFPNAVTESSYNAGNRQTAFGSQALAYDDNGNLTSISQGTDITALTWDSRNRLTALSAPTTAATFNYDGLGRRSAKTIDGTTTQFQYDGLDRVRDIVASTATGYLNGPGIDEPLARGGSEFYWVDALGSVLRLTDAGGSITTAYGYEPFGRASVTSGASTNPAQYTGRENDGTGLHYYRARYYHPGLQRFISEDPVGFAGGDVNLFGYVGNAPLDYRDPFGLDKNSGGSCAGSLPSAPPGVDVNTNMRIAAQHYNPMWFYNQVRNRGPWDYKQQGRGREFGGGKYNPYEAFGNFNYGATGAAFGFSDQTLLRMAGYAQWSAGTSVPEYGRPWGPFQPYGDDPWDQHWIQAGIRYYRCSQGISGPDPGAPSFYGIR